VTDNGIKELANHPSLTHITLDDTAISDETLDILGQIPTLSFVSVTGTDVSSQAVARLRRSANVIIHSDHTGQ
jgi:hypothetical protein